MTQLEIPCPKCGYRLLLPDRSFLGRKGRCPECQLKFIMEEQLIVDEAEPQPVDDEDQPQRRQQLVDERVDEKPERALEAPSDDDVVTSVYSEGAHLIEAESDFDGALPAEESAAAGETLEPDNALLETNADDHSLAAIGDTPAIPSGTVGDDESDAAALAVMVGDEDVPEKFGRYRIVEQIGQGSMATVYLAHDTELGRKVALKIPAYSEMNDSSWKERFYREARAAATLRHPNICQVYDVGEIDGTHFISMAYIQGNPLSTFIKKAKPPPVRKIAATVRKLARALQEAHNNGIVHRDLKPDNIIIDDRGEPIIMDFGLVRLIHENDQLTISGAIVGSPAYMSPEQISAGKETVGPGSDIFSLGVIAYELLTRKRPFIGTLDTIFYKITGDDPEPPSKLRADIDPTFESICLKMMAKDVADRYGAMDEVAEAIAGYLKKPAETPVSGDSAAELPVAKPVDADAVSSTPDETAARWVLQIGGTLKIATGDSKPVTVTEIDSLPKEPYHVVDVGLVKNSRVDDHGMRNFCGLGGLLVLRLAETDITDEGISCLSELHGLHELDLSYTKLTDDGLLHLVGLKGLNQLDLAHTQITDLGLTHLKKLAGLQFLGLYSTQVTDDGLRKLSSLKDLQFLGLYGSNVTDDGVAKLKKKLHGCTISR